MGDVNVTQAESERREIWITVHTANANEVAAILLNGRVYEPKPARTQAPASDQVRELLRAARPHVAAVKSIACAEGRTYACAKRSDLLARIDAALGAKP